MKKVYITPDVELISFQAEELMTDNVEGDIFKPGYGSVDSPEGWI